MAKSQGAQANLNGKVFENMMIPIFTEAGFEVFSQGDIKKSKKLQEKISALKRYVIRNAPYTTIYNIGGKTEFVIVADLRRIRVEAKFQSSTGSVDEKFPYMLLNGIFRYPESEIIFVVDGDGYKEAARKWLETKIKENWYDYKAKGKDIKLMKMTEFVNWFNHEF